MSNPFSLRIFVADGDPDGPRVVAGSGIAAAFATRNPRETMGAE